MDKLNRDFQSNEDEILSAEILESARQYQANDFPNLPRRGCPSNEDLLETANSGNLPADELREHLLSCSPCFLVFQTARQSKNISIAVNKAKESAKTSSWLGLFFKPLPAACLLVLLCAAGIIFYGLFFYQSAEVIKQDEIAAAKSPVEKTVDSRNEIPNTANSQIENNGIEKTASAKKQNNLAANKKQEITNSNSASSDVPPVPQNTINLDLSKAAVLRNENAKVTGYSLPSRSVILNVKLPENSPPGNYEISLRDEFNRPLLQGATRPSSGKNIIFKLDLRNTSGQARLCVAPAGEIPDCLAIRIGNAP
jgi:hypothetical protein